MLLAFATFIVRHVLDLVEACSGIAHVGGAIQWLLALFGKCVVLVRDVVAVILFQRAQVASLAASAFNINPGPLTCLEY